MLKGPVEFCFFSGTGNTALAAARIASALEARGITVHLRPIEDTDPATLPPGATIGLACPAAAFTTYPLVWRFVRNLQPGMGAGAFLVVTMGGMTMGLVGPMKRLVRRRGYTPLGACRLVMPGNFMLKKIDRAADADRIGKALSRCDSFASSLAEGRAHWIRIPGWPDLIASLIGNDRPFASMRKKLSMSVDRPACTRCGLCVSHCPTSNIRMVDYPAWADRCELCMRCHGICPTDAIRIGGKKYAQYYAKLGQQASAIQR